MVKKIFNPKRHIQNLISDKYYTNLILLRDVIEKGCDDYFRKLGAPKVDLFLISNSITSPIALGSDSKSIEFLLGNKNYFLADSSQFGMEPLLYNSFNIVYCYLPSFRGENPDSRHLNQFYHCEAEMRGNYNKTIIVAENLVKSITKSILRALNQKHFHFSQIQNSIALERIAKSDFPKISFDEAVKLLEDNGYGNLVEYKKFGRILTTKAEGAITKLVSNNKLPMWVTNYDRDTVAFYQKPDPENNSKALNADLLVPPLNNVGFSGEIIGLGQRQDKPSSIIESMRRQKIKNKGQYDWYIALRKSKKYQSTSGFGLGIERYISWILGIQDLADTSLYPFLKGVKTPY